MAVGLLVAATTGLCSLASTVMIFIVPAGQSADTNIVLIYIVIGFLVSAFGFWLFRRGRARMRRG